MFDINPVMKYDLCYQHKDLIKKGIVKIILICPMLYLIYSGIIPMFSLPVIIEVLLFLIVFILSESAVIFVGVSNIIQGRKEIRFEIDGADIRKFEDKKLKIMTTAKELKKINYIYTEPVEWKTITFHLLNKKKIKITITEKNEFPKIEEFLKFLLYYCRKYDIPFKKTKLKQEIVISC